MNIQQIITEETREVLKEKGSPDAVLDMLSQIPEDEAEAHAAKLLKVVDDALPGWIEQQAQQKQVAEGVGDPVGPIAGGLAKVASVIPGGMDLGAMYLASIDRQVPAALRMAFLIAIANFVSPIDAGTLLGLDWLGPLAVLDDLVLLRSMLKKYRKAGLPADRHYDRFEELAGAGPQEPEAVGGKEEEETVVERKLKKSHLYKIIREEVEVVLNQ